MWKCLVVIDDIWKGKKKKEGSCVSKILEMSLFIHKKTRAGKKKEAVPKVQKRNYLRRVDDFWLFLIFYQTCLLMKKSKKKRKKEQKTKEKKREKREEMRIIYIFVNQSQYELWLRKNTRTSKQRFLYPVVSIIWKNFKKKFNYRVTYDSAGMMCNFD